jgi:hypothetical protein
LERPWTDKGSVVKEGSSVDIWAIYWRLVITVSRVSLFLVIASRVVLKGAAGQQQGEAQEYRNSTKN